MYSYLRRLHKAPSFKTLLGSVSIPLKKTTCIWARRIDILNSLNSIWEYLMFFISVQWKLDRSSYFKLHDHITKAHICWRTIVDLDKYLGILVVNGVVYIKTSHTTAFHIFPALSSWLSFVASGHIFEAFNNFFQTTWCHPLPLRNAYSAKKFRAPQRLFVVQPRLKINFFLLN